MANSYLARLERVERVPGFGNCSDDRCEKCIDSRARDLLRGVEPIGCDGRPDAESDLAAATTEELLVLANREIDPYSE